MLHRLHILRSYCFVAEVTFKWYEHQKNCAKKLFWYFFDVYFLKKLIGIAYKYFRSKNLFKKHNYAPQMALLYVLLKHRYTNFNKNGMLKNFLKNGKLEKNNLVLSGIFWVLLAFLMPKVKYHPGEILNIF